MNWSHGLVNGLLGKTSARASPSSGRWQSGGKSNRIVSPGMNRHLLIYGKARERKGMGIAGLVSKNMNDGESTDEVSLWYLKFHIAWLQLAHTLAILPPKSSVMGSLR